ncbi:caspase family protein [Streptomyces sp. NPDC058686]|uniref:HD domain-containing protein n=1 Tax=Streptomyces sp. NPDC058686 TaxID=3346599 RepID=UPI0036611B12
MASEKVAAEPEGRRRALVIGIGQTPDLDQDEHLSHRFPRLDCAPEDVELVGTALRQSSYEVRQLHDPGGFALLGALRKFFESCAPGDTAFLYVSCHGTTIDGRDYLLPFDAQPGAALAGGEGRALFDRTLIAADPDGLLQGLPAGTTAVVCLDTCRTTEPNAAADSTRDTLLTRAEDVYWLHSCSRGERSYADPKEGSWFGRALAKALAPTTQPTTFADLVAHTRATVRKIASDAGVAPPTIERYVPHGRGDNAAGPVLCDGAQEAYRWTTMIEQSALWEYTSGSAATHERVKKRLGAVVEHVVDSLAGAGAHRSDPWADPTYPVRVVDRLEGLVKRACLDGRDLLSPAETAALLAAPVVHEGVVAIALDELRRTVPERMDTDEVPPGGLDGHDQLVRDAARDVCRAHSQVRRTAATLLRRGLKDQALAADHWLRHRFIAEWDLLWEQTGAYATVDRILDLVVTAVVDAAEEPTAVPARETTRVAIDSQLRQVLGHLAVHPSGSPRINDPRKGDEWNTYPPVPGNQWRAPELARLLWSAALLAADPRRMSSVLVDHLGAHEPLDPAEVVAALSADFRYDVTQPRDHAEGSYGLAVRFPCPHPALHVAVEELAARAGTAVSTLHLEWQKQRTAPPALLRGFPEQVTTEQLVPLGERYKQPLERFRLAEDEIRPLLMGTQLYGDRMLSVRELYQNALDACRYRDMRRQYGVTQGRRGPDWQPRITFSQGWDTEGRPYIECTDNGSGMNRAKLTSMFARAGKRYEQDSEFVQERRNWRRAGLTEMPLNSRFGIGVFSYFMLAEEVVVWTNPVDHYGRPTQPQPLRADIQSGSGLLRLSDDPQVSLDGGTRVRLYLGEDEKTPPSLVETLESLLWVADFEVEAVEYARDTPRRVLRQSRWVPGELKATPADPWRDAPAQGSADVWLVQGNGKWLLDGVVIKGGPDTFGRVVNLRERHRPEPSVDRNSLLSYDDRVVLDELLGATPLAAAQWDEVALTWLWELAERAPQLAVKVLDSLRPDVLAVIDPKDTDASQPLCRTTPLAVAGCLPHDKTFRRVHRARSAGGALVSGSYAGELAGKWQASRLAAEYGEPFLPQSYPAPESLDALLFQTTPPRSWERALEVSNLLDIPLGRTLRAWRRYAVVGYGAPAVQDIRSLRELKPHFLASDLSHAYEWMGGRPSYHGPLRPATHAPLLLVASRYRRTLGEMAELLGELRSLQPELPEPPELDDALATLTPTRGESLALVSPDTNPAGEWLPGTVRPVDLISRVTPSLTLDDLIELITLYEPLGFSCPTPPSAPARRHGPLTQAERALLSTAGIRPGQRTVRLREEDLTLAELLRLSYRLRIPPGELADQINSLSDVTAVRSVVPPAVAAQWIPPQSAYTALKSLHPQSPPRLSPWQFIMSIRNEATQARSVHPGPTEPTEIREILGILNDCGLLTPDCAQQTDAIVRELADDDASLSRRLHPSVTGGRLLDDEGVTPAHLMRLSSTERRTVGEVLEDLRADERGLPVRVAQPAPETLHLKATHHDCAALLRRDSFVRELTITGLLDHARSGSTPLSATVECLSQFIPLGAPAVPGDFTGPDADALAGFTPGLLDLVAFEQIRAGGDILDPLQLVRMAGRFGWTIGRTYERYAPFRCLGLDVTVRAPNPEEASLAPDWRDVIILTEQLTGRAPALFATVTADDIALRSEETDLSEDQVRERLGRYARLFSLELPQPIPAPGEVTTP